MPLTLGVAHMAYTQYLMAFSLIRESKRRLHIIYVYVYLNSHRHWTFNSMNNIIIIIIIIETGQKIDKCVA